MIAIAVSILSAMTTVRKIVAGYVAANRSFFGRV